MIRPKPFSPTFPTSFTVQPVGTAFAARDLAGLSPVAFALGIEVEHPSSDGWIIRPVRLDLADAPNIFNVDQVGVMWVGDRFVRYRLPRPVDHHRPDPPPLLAPLLHDLPIPWRF